MIINHWIRANKFLRFVDLVTEVLQRLLSLNQKDEILKLLKAE